MDDFKQCIPRKIVKDSLVRTYLKIEIRIAAFFFRRSNIKCTYNFLFSSPSYRTNITKNKTHNKDKYSPPNIHLLFLLFPFKAHFFFKFFHSFSLLFFQKPRMSLNITSLRICGTSANKIVNMVYKIRL